VEVILGGVIMFVAKLVLLGLALLPIVAFGLIFKHLVSDDKNRIMASTEDWEEVGLGSGTDVFEDGFYNPHDTLRSPVHYDVPGNMFYSPPVYDPDIYDD